MNTSAYKTVVHDFYADVWNRHDKSAIPRLLRPDFTFRGSLGQSRVGHAEFADYVDFVHQALGEYRCDILDLVAEGDQCFARMRFSGNHRGDFFGFKPTGKRLEWAGAALFTFRDGRVRTCGCWGMCRACCRHWSAMRRELHSRIWGMRIGGHLLSGYAALTRPMGHAGCAPAFSGAGGLSDV